MIQKLLQKILGNKSEKDLKEIQPYVTKIHAAEQSIQGFTPDQLRLKTQEFKSKIKASSIAEQEEIIALKSEAEIETSFETKEKIYSKID